MEISKLTSVMEELGLTEEQKNGVLYKLQKMNETPAPASGLNKDALINELKKEMHASKDWRKKAFLASRIISVEYDYE